MNKKIFLVLSLVFILLFPSFALAQPQEPIKVSTWWGPVVFFMPDGRVVVIDEELTQTIIKPQYPQNPAITIYQNGSTVTQIFQFTKGYVQIDYKFLTLEPRIKITITGKNYNLNNFGLSIDVGDAKAKGKFKDLSFENSIKSGKIKFDWSDAIKSNKIPKSQFDEINNKHYLSWVVDNNFIIDPEISQDEGPAPPQQVDYSYSVVAWGDGSSGALTVSSGTVTTSYSYYWSYSASNTTYLYNFSYSFPQNTYKQLKITFPKGMSIINITSLYVTTNIFPSALREWQYRKSHTITGSTAGAVTDYQIRIVVWNTTGTDSGENVYLGSKVRPDFGDVRFTDANGNLLSYWIESINSSAAVFWVKVPSISASPDTATIYIYYGNPTATTTSNGTATFIFFDDFESYADGSAINGQGGWITKRVGGSGEAAVRLVNGRKHLHLSSTDAGTTVVRPLSVNNSGVAFRIYEYGVNVGECIKQGFMDGNTDAYGIEYNGYVCAWWGVGGKTSALVRVVSGSHTILASISDSDTANIYRTLEFTWFGSSLAGFRNGVQMISASDTYYSSRTYIELHVWSPTDRYIDWVLVRKYVSPEPSHGSWGSEEDAVVRTYNPILLSSTEYTLTTYNSTHWCIIIPDSTINSKPGPYLLYTSATCAVYDLKL